MCQIVLLHILKEGRGEGFIIQTELLMVSKVHLLVQTLLVMHTRGGNGSGGREGCDVITDDFGRP